MVVMRLSLSWPTPGPVRPEEGLWSFLTIHIHIVYELKGSTKNMCLLVGCTGLDQDGETVLSVSSHHNYDKLGYLC